jgi:hypothetical protein
VSERRLRVAFVAVQPELVWDDGEQFLPGPEVELMRLPLAQARQVLEELPVKIAALAEQIRQAEQARAEPDDERCLIQR